MSPRILLMYISKNSGHHRASLAIEHAVKRLGPDCITLNINGFNYTNPILERVINKTYMGVIRTKPEVWEYLYDNPKIFRRAQRIRDFIHNLNFDKLKKLLDDFKPDVIVCTQAFPCGMIADLKQSNGLRTPLFGVLTDYFPHSYWVYNSVDYYNVASEQAKTRLSLSGVPDEKIKTFGIPIDGKFKESPNPSRVKAALGLNTKEPVVLVMGGGQGYGPIRHVITALDKLKTDFQVLVVCGSNKKLYRWANSRFRRFSKHIVSMGYVSNVHEAMHACDLIVTKPGGLTTAEALSKGLPMVIVKPIPGQEAKNAQFLTSIGAAEKIDSIDELPYAIESVLNNPYRQDKMRQAALNYARPNAADDIARLILSSCGN